MLNPNSNLSSHSISCSATTFYEKRTCQLDRKQVEEKNIKCWNKLLKDQRIFYNCVVHEMGKLRPKLPPRNKRCLKKKDTDGNQSLSESEATENIVEPIQLVPESEPIQEQQIDHVEFRHDYVEKDAFIKFADSLENEIRNSNPDYDSTEMIKVAWERWNDVSEEERKKFKDECTKKHDYSKYASTSVITSRMIFVSQNRRYIKKMNSDLTPKEIDAQIHLMWQNLPHEKKDVYKGIINVINRRKFMPASGGVSSQFRLNAEHENKSGKKSDGKVRKEKTFRNRKDNDINSKNDGDAKQKKENHVRHKRVHLEKHKKDHTRKYGSSKANSTQENDETNNHETKQNSDSVFRADFLERDAFMEFLHDSHDELQEFCLPHHQEMEVIWERWNNLTENQREKYRHSENIRKKNYTKYSKQTTLCTHTLYMSFTKNSFPEWQALPKEETDIYHKIKHEISKLKPQVMKTQKTSQRRGPRSFLKKSVEPPNEHETLDIEEDPFQDISIMTIEVPPHEPIDVSDQYLPQDALDVMTQRSTKGPAQHASSSPECPSLDFAKYLSSDMTIHASKGKTYSNSSSNQLSSKYSQNEFKETNETLNEFNYDQENLSQQNHISASELKGRSSDPKNNLSSEDSFSFLYDKTDSSLNSYNFSSSSNNHASNFPNYNHNSSDFLKQSDLDSPIKAQLSDLFQPKPEKLEISSPIEDPFSTEFQITFDTVPQTFGSTKLFPSPISQPSDLISSFQSFDEENENSFHEETKNFFNEHEDLFDSQSSNGTSTQINHLLQSSKEYQFATKNIPTRTSLKAKRTLIHHPRTEPVHYSLDSIYDTNSLGTFNDSLNEQLSSINQQFPHLTHSEKLVTAQQLSTKQQNFQKKVLQSQFDFSLDRNSVTSSSEGAFDDFSCEFSQKQKKTPLNGFNAFLEYFQNIPSIKEKKLTPNEVTQQAKDMWVKLSPEDQASYAS